MMVCVGSFKIISQRPEELPSLIDVARALGGVTEALEATEETPALTTARTRKRALSSKRPMAALPGTPPKDAWQTFTSLVQGKLRRILTYVVEKPGSTRMDMIRDLGIDQNCISGHINAILRYGKPLGISKSDVLVINQIGKGRKRVLHYYPGPKLKEPGLGEP